MNANTIPEKYPGIENHKPGRMTQESSSYLKQYWQIKDIPTHKNEF